MADSLKKYDGSPNQGSRILLQLGRKESIEEIIQSVPAAIYSESVNFADPFISSVIPIAQDGTYTITFEFKASSRSGSMEIEV